ncbi:MAG: ABC transporter permease, partial [Betaproteobacteria bacterium]
MNAEKLSTYGWSLAVLLVFGLAWELLPGWFGVPAFVLPPPSKVWTEFLRLWQAERLLWHAGITAFEVVVGFVLGSVMGAVIGYALGMSPRVEAVLLPYLLALQIAPKV